MNNNNDNNHIYSTPTINTLQISRTLNLVTNILEFLKKSKEIQSWMMEDWTQAAPNDFSGKKCGLTVGYYHGKQF